MISREDNNMRLELRIVMLLCFVSFACGGAGSNGGSSESSSDAESQEQLGPYGPPMGVNADVVRSVTLKLSGDMNAEFTGKKGDGSTGVMGLCNPETFANFSLQLPGAGYERVDAAIMSKGEIGTGETGEFRLDYLWVTLFDENMNSYDFKGPGTMTITRHDASPGNRRMVGTIQAKGLAGSNDAEGKTVDAEVQFDMDYSCGVKE